MEITYGHVGGTFTHGLRLVRGKIGDRVAVVMVEEGVDPEPLLREKFAAASEVVFACSCGHGVHTQFRRISAIHFESFCSECGSRMVAPAETITGRQRATYWVNDEVFQQ